MQPETSQDWIDIANEREADARHLSEKDRASLGSFYMAGYIIECSLKALIEAKGKRFLKEHDLRKLWRHSDLRLRDFRSCFEDELNYFLDEWVVDLRYELNFQPAYPTDRLISAAAGLKSRLERMARQSQRRRR